jgi:hypothetical protein
MNDPVGVEVEAVIVNMLVKGGLPDCGLNDADAPGGSPDTDNDTGSVKPETRLTVIVLEPEKPCVIVNRLSAFTEKSNGGGYPSLSSM